MKARPLQELDDRFKTSGACCDRPTMEETWQLLNGFIMVCSLDLIIFEVDGFLEKFSD